MTANELEAASLVSNPSEGLAGFLDIWLDQFQVAGGYISATEKGGRMRPSFGFVDYSDSPAFKAAPEHLDPAAADRFQAWHEGAYLGALRALQGLLVAMPGAGELLAELVNARAERSSGSAYATAGSGSGSCPEFPDSSILDAWATCLAARDAIGALPEQHTTDDQVEVEAAHWSRCDQAEKVILETPATTPAGVAAKLRVALLHSLNEPEQEDAIRRGDFGGMDMTRMDWGDRFVVSAIRSLEAMAGETRLQSETGEPS